MFIIAFGAMVSYLMIVKDSFSIFFHVDSGDTVTQNLVLLGISFCIQLPLACLRDMADLDKSSRTAVVIDIMLVAIVAYSAPWREKLEEEGGMIQMLAHDTIHFDSIFVGLGVLSFAFECQESAFLVAGSLKDPTTQRWSTVTKFALLICVALALCCGSAGYLGYMDQTNGNILNNLDKHSWAGKVSHGMLGTTMFATYPLASFVARHVCVVLLFGRRTDDEGNDTSILDRVDRRIFLTLGLYIFAYIFAATCKDFGLVLALAGVVGGSCIAYIGPGMLYLGVNGGRFLELVEESWLSPKSTSNQTVHRPLTATVETTPLVASRKEGDDLMRNQLTREQDQVLDSRTVVGRLRTTAYCLAGFPLWCRIAAMGKKTLTEHVHALVEQSPHPVRIGNMQYRLARVLEDGKIDADPRESTVVSHPKYMQQYSAPLEGSAHGISMSPGAGKNVSVDRPKLSKTNVAGKIQTRDTPQSWFDFVVAIFYILFGVMALFAGLYSLFAPEDVSEPTATALAAANTPLEGSDR